MPRLTRDSMDRRHSLDRMLSRYDRFGPAPKQSRNNSWAPPYNVTDPGAREFRLLGGAKKRQQLDNSLSEYLQQYPRAATKQAARVLVHNGEEGAMAGASAQREACEKDRPRFVLEICVQDIRVQIFTQNGG